MIIQIVHNSLLTGQVTSGELEIINSLKDQGIDIVLYDESNELKFLFRWKNLQYLYKFLLLYNIKY